MHNPHDDDLTARVAEIRSRHHSTWSEEDMDDLASEKQIATLDRLVEEYQARKRQQGSPPTIKPNN